MYLKFGFLGFQFLSLILTNIQDVYPFSQIPDTSYILRLKDEFYETSQPKSFNCRTVYCCALRCHQFQGCVAFSYKGQEVPSLPETSTSCYLISVDDTKKTLTIVKKPQMFYYEMDCDRFCDLYNAELKVLPCVIGGGIPLVNLPKCTCKPIHPDCGILPV